MTPQDLRPSLYRPRFQGSDRLFRHCWRRLRRHVSQGMDLLDSDEVQEYLELLASDAVNNPRSSFYISG